MVFNEDDILWIDICKKNPDIYCIKIDIDMIYVFDTKSNKLIYKFSSNGIVFAMQLLKYIGCSAEFSICLSTRREVYEE